MQAATTDYITISQSNSPENITCINEIESITCGLPDIEILIVYKQNIINNDNDRTNIYASNVEFCKKKRPPQRSSRLGVLNPETYNKR